MQTPPAAPRSPSWASSDATRATMRANRGRNTEPELAVRRRVHSVGLRYRVNARPEPHVRRTIDLLFRRAHIVVLIDGCFRHGARYITRLLAPMRTAGRRKCTPIERATRRRIGSSRTVDGSYCGSGSTRSARTRSSWLGRSSEQCAPAQPALCPSIASSTGPKKPVSLSLPTTKVRSSSRFDDSHDVSGARLHA
jgi:DNA mismatch endonuclease Vsr